MNRVIEIIEKLIKENKANFYKNPDEYPANEIVLTCSKYYALGQEDAFLKILNEIKKLED